jgi:hypothetical protein
MRQRLALIAIKKNDVAGCGLLLAQLQTQAYPIALAGHLPPFQRVPRPPVTALDQCYAVGPEDRGELRAGSKLAARSCGEF